MNKIKEYIVGMFLTGIIVGVGGLLVFVVIGIVDEVVGFDKRCKDNWPIHETKIVKSSFLNKVCMVKIEGNFYPAKNIQVIPGGRQTVIQIESKQ